MPQHCFKLLNKPLLTGAHLKFIGWTNKDPAYLMSTNPCHLTPNLHFTEISSHLLKNTTVFLNILDFAYVFSSDSIFRFVHLGKKCVQLQVSDQSL